MKNLSLALIFLLPSMTFSQSTSRLPLCIDNPKVLETLQQTMKTPPKNKHRYDGYKKALARRSDVEIFTRLAYAETLAANCTEQNSPISARIVNVIGNRVKKRNGDIKSVVFQPSQFASSLHIYESSKYKDFLCPKDATLWKDISAKVQNFLAKGSGELSADTVNYFLYKHDPRWTKEPWDLKEDNAATNDNIRACLRTFHVPNWK